MKVVIVAAGKSSRMYPLTLNTPKSLLELNDLTIIEHSIKNLRKNGMKEICVVTGYLKEQFFKVLKNKVTFVFNPFYKITNNMASLWFAGDFVKNNEFLYLHGDLVYHPDLIKKCLEKKGEGVLVVDKKECDKEDMKVKVKNGLIIESSKEIPLSKAYGEWIGIAKFSKKINKILFEKMGNLIERGKINVYDTYAFTQLVKEGIKINFIKTEGLPWVEVDFIKEYEKAKDTFFSFK